MGRLRLANRGLSAHPRPDAAPVEQGSTDQLHPLNYPVPFTDKVVPLIPVARIALPALIIVFTVWMAWRSVNVPVFGDFLNDGHPHLFVPQDGGCKLFRNDGKGKFTDVTTASGLDKFKGRATSAAV